MKTPPEHPDEASRLRALRALGLAGEPEERFDRITRLARRMFGVDHAFINLVGDEYQWTLSTDSENFGRQPRQRSLCAHAILERAPLVIADLSRDSRFVDHPVTAPPRALRFYAARPLHAPDGHAVGTLCLFDRHSRILGLGERQLLDDLGAIAERELATSRLAATDDATAVTSRRGLFARAPDLLERCREHSQPASLIRFGLRADEQPAPQTTSHEAAHSAADGTVIRRFADLLQDTYRHNDIVARIGDGDFALLAADCGARAAEHLILRLQRAVDRDNQRRDGARRPVGFHYGIASTPADCDDGLDTLLSVADARLTENTRHRHAP